MKDKDGINFRREKKDKDKPYVKGEKTSIFKRVDNRKFDADKVKAKKHLGQHFLKDKNVSRKIAQQFTHHRGVNTILEIGPGMGALTEFLMEDPTSDVWVMDIDLESIVYLQKNFPTLGTKILGDDFLKSDPNDHFHGKPFAVIGNFPYNISSQIMFRCLEYRNQVTEVMGMFQKEVAERIAIGPGTKTYGILSVLMQTYYDIHYCFTVDEHVFDPPPKVKSGVIRCTRNNRESLPCDEKLFKQIVKASFNQRRKTIRNSIRSLMVDSTIDHPLLLERPEQLSVDQFIELTLLVESQHKPI
jgi:16S rRNA (adenine1518-N6/adenine1519-N6)-dimethyltransferase